jgi:hypothetical protein
MQAFPFGSGREVLLQSDNISGNGAFFSGDPRVAAGATLLLRLELGTELRGRENIYPLNVEVRVSRLSRSDDGSVGGFGAEWVAVWSNDDASPLMQFLRRTLQLSSGYIQTLVSGTAGGRRLFLYMFPAGTAPLQAVVTPYEEQHALESAPLPLKVPDAVESFEGGVDLDQKSSSPEKNPNAGMPVYVAVPLTWSVDGTDYEGRATKLTTTGLRIVTQAALPGAYRRVTVRIQIRQRDRPGTLSLSGTVVTQRASREEGLDSQMEVQLTLGNDPDNLQLYRKLLDRLASMAAPVGA